jgi:NAD(P)-dependent dehydrogenase (short-subunit alcohol dehydrogenase family)
MGRPGTPEEFAGAAVYLASDAARYVTGIVLDIHGGMKSPLPDLVSATLPGAGR